MTTSHLPTIEMLINDAMRLKKQTFYLLNIVKNQEKDIAYLEKELEKLKARKKQDNKQ